MSDNLSVLSTIPINVDCTEFLGETNRVARLLLNQPDSFSLDIRIVKIDGTHPIPVEGILQPSSELYGLHEMKYLNGILIHYDINEYPATFSAVPVYDFSLLEIHRQRKDLAVMLAIAATIAVARIFSATTIEDSGGLCGRDTEYPLVEDLMSYAVKENLTFDDALQAFYDNLGTVGMRRISSVFRPRSFD